MSPKPVDLVGWPIHEVRRTVDRKIQVTVYGGAPFVMEPRDALSLAKSLKRVTKPILRESS